MAYTFSTYLNQAIHQIGQVQAWKLARVEYEITQALAVQGFPVKDYTLEGWRRGRRLPKNHGQVAALVRFCKEKGRVDCQLADAILQAANYSDRRSFLASLYPLGPALELAPPPVMLPQRPERLLGRTKEIAQLRQALSQGPGFYAIIGQPGVGKSALAAELVHQLVNDPHLSYPDGIVTLTYRPLSHAAEPVAIVKELLTHFSEPVSSDWSKQELLVHTHTALTQKRALILLEDVPPDFPLDLVAPLWHTQSQRQRGRMEQQTGLTVLLTSQKWPPAGLATFCLALAPLPAGVALALLESLLGRPLDETEIPVAQQLCETMGGLPSALEWAAQALSLGLSLTFLARLLSSPPELVLNDAEGLYARFAQAVTMLPTDLHERFSRLAPLGTAPFTLEDATLMRLPEAIWASENIFAEPTSVVDATRPRSVVSSTGQRVPFPDLATPDLVQRVLTGTTADVLHLAQHSLLQRADRVGNGTFRLPPLAQAVAADLERKFYAEALALAEQYQLALPQAQTSRVLTALAHAWSSANFGHVIELAYSLYWAVGDMPAQQGERILRWGVEASQHLHDRYYLVRFLTRLGKLRFYRGDLTFAEQVWEESAELTEPLFRHIAPDRLTPLLLPLSNLTLIPGIQEEYEAAERSTWRLIRKSEEAGAVGMVGDAYMKAAFYDRLLGERDRAAREIAHSSELLAEANDTPLFKAEQAVEMARIAGDFEQAARLFSQLLQVIRDPMPKADALYDHATFAWQQQRIQEARRYGQQSLALAQTIRAPITITMSRKFLTRLPS